MSLDQRAPDVGVLPSVRYLGIDEVEAYMADFSLLGIRRGEAEVLEIGALLAES